MLYDLTNVTGMVELWQFNQTVSPFGEMVLIAIFIVAFVGLKVYESLRALPAALFITGIAALLLRILGLLPEAWFYAAVVSLAASIVLLYGRESQ